MFDYEGCFTLKYGKVVYSKGKLEKLMDNVRHSFVEDQYGFGLAHVFM